MVWSRALYDQDDMWGRLADRVLIAALCGKVGVAVKIEDMIIQSHLQWYGHVMGGDINSQTCEEVEITGERKKSRPRKLKKT